MEPVRERWGCDPKLASALSLSMTTPNPDRSRRGSNFERASLIFCIPAATNLSPAARSKFTSTASLTADLISSLRSTSTLSSLINSASVNIPQLGKTSIARAVAMLMVSCSSMTMLTGIEPASSPSKIRWIFKATLRATLGKRFWTTQASIPCSTSLTSKLEKLGSFRLFNSSTSRLNSVRGRLVRGPR